MDDKHIHDLLDDYAKKEIPNEMNIWNDVKAELTLPGRASRTRSMSLVLALLLMLGAAFAVYAVVNQQIVGDPGIEGAREANLVTDLNLSQTIDDVTMTLAWAYLDASRLTIGYSITAPAGQEGITYNTNMHISDAANSFFASGAGGGGGGGTDVSRESQYMQSYGIAFIENPPDMLDMRAEFILEAAQPILPDIMPRNPGALTLTDESGLGDIATESVTLTNLSPEAVDLAGWTIADQTEHLYTFPSFTLEPNATVIVFTRVGEDTSTELYWGEEEAIWVPGELLTAATNHGVVVGFYEVGGRSSGEGGDSGGGFGTGGYPEGTPQPGIRNYGGLSLQNPIGPFVFEFSMPYITSLQLAPNQTVDSGGISMTFDSLIVSPSTTTAHFCYNLPDSRDWFPEITLMAGETEVGMASGGGDGLPTPEDTNRCMSITFYAPYQLEPTTFTFTISDLHTSNNFTPEGAERFKAILAEQGIEVEVGEASGEGFNYDIISQPDGDVGMAVQQAMNAAFSNHHPGVWVFTVEVPALER